MSQVFEAMVRVWRERAGRVNSLLLAAVVVTALAPAAASAAPPRITKGPTISGTAQVGQTLTAVDYAYSGGTATWIWWRCSGPRPTLDDCDEISGADKTSYEVVDADKDFVLRVVLTVSKGDDYRESVSPQTSTVTAAPAPPPEPTPTPTPAPTPAPSPDPDPPGSQGTPTTGSPAAITTSPQALDSGGVLGETVRPALMMAPTPLVRIRGVMTRNGVRLTLLTVRAPKGARITILCKGRSCPAKKWVNTAAVVRATKFQRALRAGTRLTIKVTKPGRIGKYTVIVIRKDKMPKRSDRCLYPGARRPVACPAS